MNTSWELGICPWCHELVGVEHEIGCPNPQYPLTEEGWRLVTFVEALTGVKVPRDEDRRPLPLGEEE